MSCVSRGSKQTTSHLAQKVYSPETWSLTLREEHMLRVFENRVLRRIFRPKRDEVTGSWRKLRNEELHNLYSSPHISMKMAVFWNVAPCSLVDIDRRFRGTYCFHHQGDVKR
jgi:hypothetical protein